MADNPNVVKPGESPTPPVIPTPLPSGSPASPASPKAPEGVKPPVTGAPAAGAGQAPEPKTVPIEALHEERSKRQALDNQMTQLKAVLGDKFTFDANGNAVLIGAPAVDPNANPDQTRIQEEVEKAWNEDPKKAVRMEQMMALSWYDQIHWSIEDQKSLLAEKNPDFKLHEKEINNYIRRLPLDRRSTPGAVELAYLVVKGKNPANMEEARKLWEAEFMRKMQAGEGAAGVGAGTFSAAPASGVQATQDQINAAGAMGMKIEDYMKNVK